MISGGAKSNSPKNLQGIAGIDWSPKIASGKVREIFDLDDCILVATDRISAFDVVLQGGIPAKGRFLLN